MDHDRNEEALQVLADLHGKGDANAPLVQLEYHEIKESVAFDRTEGSKSIMDIFQPGILRRVSLGMSLQAWSQLSGMLFRQVATEISMLTVVYRYECYDGTLATLEIRQNV